jgi:uncharacterized protein (DUF433 family)
MAEPVIVTNPEIMSGTPCFRGTRVPFKNLIDYLEGGGRGSWWRLWGWGMGDG